MKPTTVQGRYGEAAFFVDAFGVPHLMYDGLHLIITRAETDDVHLVYIDADGMPQDAHGPLCRIDLNDATIYENPPSGGKTSV
jgi:hypothetical protein